jgi:hypothetical protein
MADRPRIRTVPPASSHDERQDTLAYIHIATSRGFTVDDVRMIEEKVGDRSAIEGLLVESYGQDGDVMRVVTILGIEGPQGPLRSGTPPSSVPGRRHRGRRGRKHRVRRV